MGDSEKKAPIKKPDQEAMADDSIDLEALTRVRRARNSTVPLVESFLGQERKINDGECH